MNKYFIKEEIMGGETYYMIYRKFLGILSFTFYERWNTFESATQRLNELNKE